MKGLVVFTGGSFRLGSQGNTSLGDSLSYTQQIEAAQSHIHFLKNLNVDVRICTYSTQYDTKLVNVYKHYKPCVRFIKGGLLGLDSLFHMCLDDIEEYDYLIYIRLDLFLKDHFSEVFDPTWDTIRFPTICWKQDSVIGKHPRVNDAMLFVPKKYFIHLPYIHITHETWRLLVSEGHLTSNDLDTMINTYHDSDSEKDYNPLYRVVNRPEQLHWHSKGYVFNKEDFLQ
jgi:hypothetical protein